MFHVTSQKELLKEPFSVKNLFMLRDLFLLRRLFILANLFCDKEPIYIKEPFCIKEPFVPRNLFTLGYLQKVPQQPTIPKRLIVPENCQSLILIHVTTVSTNHIIRNSRIMRLAKEIPIQRPKVFTIALLKIKHNIFLTSIFHPL